MTHPLPDAATVSALIFPDLAVEFDSTRKLLERYPEEHGDWKPHEKSMSMRALAVHLTQIPHLAARIARDPEWDVKADPWVRPTARSRDEILALFDDARKDAEEAIARVEYSALTEEWRLGAGAVTYFSGERGLLLRRMLVSHTAHHRGQLTVYYRLRDVPVPGLYGPSADG